MILDRLFERLTDAAQHLSALLIKCLPAMTEPALGACLSTLPVLVLGYAHSPDLILRLAPVCLKCVDDILAGVCILIECVGLVASFARCLRSFLARFSRELSGVVVHVVLLWQRACTCCLAALYVCLCEL